MEETTNNQTRRRRAAPRRAAILVPADPVTGPHDSNGVDWPAEADAVLIAALQANGFKATVVPVSLDTVESVIADLRADLVVNLCDGFDELDGYPGLTAIDALEKRGLPYTGARRQAYWIGCDKLRMKLHFLNAGVPTPAFQMFGDPEEAIDAGLTYPMFVKPVSSGGSSGIDLGSVVHDELALRARLRLVIPQYGPALVEHYVDGRELTVGFFGDGEQLEVLPPLEVAFGDVYPADRKVRTFATKSDKSSPLYTGFRILCPAPLAPEVEARVLEVARQAYVSTGGSGYGRVDIRLGAEGPMVLEVNPNCSLEWIPNDEHDSGLFPLAAHAAGLDLQEIYRRLIDIALARVTTTAQPRTRSRRRKAAKAK